jgi:hypothetical protein
MQKVFICYRREDSIDTAGRIYDWMAARLPEGGVFLDVDSILAGRDFREALEMAFNETGIVLALIGQKWLNVTDHSGLRRLDDPKDFVRLEIEAATQRSIPIVPVLLQGVEMPGADRLPPPLAPFAYRNALAVRPNPDFGRDMERLTKAIEGYAPELTFADAPIPGRGSRIQRGASPPVPTTASPAVQREAPPIVPVRSAVRAIHYPWMARRLIYIMLLAAAALGTNGYIMQENVFNPQEVTMTVASVLFGAFSVAAVIIYISVLVHILVIVGRQRRWGWFIGILVSPVFFFVPPFFWPLLGLWAFALAGPTTPARPQGAKSKPS